MSKIDPEDNLDADKLRKLLPGIIENQLLELSDHVYKTKEKDTIESVLQEISERETLVSNETQEKTVDNEVTEEQMVNSVEVRPFQIKTLNRYLMILISLLTRKK